VVICHDQPIKTALRGGEVWKINYEIHDSLDRVEPPALLTGELPRLTWRVMLRMVTAENGDIREWEVGVEFGEFGEVLGESWWVGRAGQAGRSEVTRGYRGGFTVSKSPRLSTFNFPSRDAAEFHN